MTTNRFIMIPCAFDDLWEILSEDALLLTANQRLATYLRGRYAQEQQITVWQAESIMPLSEWVIEQWQRFNPSSLLLNAAQEQALWQQIVRADIADAMPLLRIAPMAQLAMKTYHHCQQWQISIAEIPAPHTPDVAAFVRWANAFEQHCRQRNWWVEAQLMTQLITQQGLPKKIILLGFEELTPQLQALQKHLIAQGSIVEAMKGARPLAMVSPHACQNEDAELRVAMHWAKQQASSGKTVAVVLPALQIQRHKVSRLAAEMWTEIPYAISGGVALADCPIINAALAAIRIKWAVDLPLVSHLLLSPFLRGAATESTARSLADLRVRSQPAPSGHLAEWQTVLQTFSDMPLFQESFAKVMAIKWLKVASPAEWASQFIEVLTAWGWADETVELSNSESHAVTKLYEVLDRMSSLSLITPRVSAAVAYSQLQQLLSVTLFQPQDPVAPQIEVLGLLETAGLEFDAIWICGLSSDVWPQPAAPTPLLPMAWQRQLGMPHASAAREIAYAEQLFTDLRRQCQMLYCSYPQTKGDIVLEPSPLLTRYGVPVVGSPPPTLTESLATTSLSIEAWQEGMNVPVSALEQQTLRGGASILKHQSLCPFQAFATVRLGLEPFPEPQEILDLRLRGILLHEVLEQVWRYLKTRQTLLAHLQTGDWAWLSIRIQPVLTKWQERYPHILTTAMKALELQRLSVLVQRWLTLEAERTDFVVLSQEKEVYAHFQGIPLKLRLDRIDQLANGERVIIDYKTGKTDYQQWFEDRPTEIQLPLYAVLTPVSGAVFAEIRPEQMQFSGITAKPDMLPGVEGIANLKENFKEWETLLAHWQRLLSTLATQFLAGDARVDPVSPEQACRYCHLQAVCRISKLM